MSILNGDQVEQRVENVVHAETQIHDFEIDLTAGSVYRITGAGSIDFGGSELADAPRERLEAEPASPDDKYGWWELGPGSYVVRYNETVEPGKSEIGFVQAHERILRAGAHHAAFHFRGRRENLEVLLNVGSGGCRLKENCRVSKLLVFDIAASPA